MRGLILMLIAIAAVVIAFCLRLFQRYKRRRAT
jgi:hypothetical protein